MSSSAAQAPAPPQTTTATTTNPSAALASTSSAPSAEAGKSKTRTITEEAKDELHTHFASLNWPLNKCLPRGAFASDLQKIVVKCGLASTQDWLK